MNKKTLGSFLFALGALFSLMCSALPARALDVPQISILNYKLDKTDYAAGDTISGSFVFENRMASPVSNISYFVTVTPTDADPSASYGRKDFGPITLDAKQKKPVHFAFPLDPSLTGEFSVHVEAYGDANLPLSWNDIVIGVSGGTALAPLSVSDVSVVADGAKFAAEAGPMVAKTGSISGTITNPQSAAVEISPELSISERHDSAKVLSLTNPDSFTVPAKGKKSFSIALPTFGFAKPGVYLGSLRFLDSSKAERAPTIRFRYIIGGDGATLYSAVIDKTSAARGDVATLKIQYAGSPYDITTGNEPAHFPGTLKALVYNEKDELVASYEAPFDFNSGTSASAPLSFTADAKALRADVFAMKGSSVLSELSVNLSSGYDAAKAEVAKESADDSNPLRAEIAVGVALFMLVLAASVYFYERGKPRGRNAGIFFAILALCFLGAAALKTEAFVKLPTSGIYGNGTKKVVDSKKIAKWSWLDPILILNNPPEHLDPGEQFYIDARVIAAVCGNSPGRVLFNLEYQGKTYTAKDSKRSRSNYVDNGKQHHTGEPTPDYSHDFVFGPFTAPSSDGTYKVNISVGNDIIRDGYFVRSRLDGYQEFTVGAGSSAIGILDQASCKSITGWACDPSDASSTVDVAFYDQAQKDENGSDMYIGSATASLPADSSADAAAIAAQCGGTSAHRFSMSASEISDAGLADGNNHSIYALANDDQSERLAGGDGSSKYVFSCSSDCPAGSSPDAYGACQPDQDQCTNLTALGKPIGGVTGPFYDGPPDGYYQIDGTNECAPQRDCTVADAQCGISQCDDGTGYRHIDENSCSFPAECSPDSIASVEQQIAGSDGNISCDSPIGEEVFPSDIGFDGAINAGGQCTLEWKIADSHAGNPAITCTITGPDNFKKTFTDTTGSQAISPSIKLPSLSGAKYTISCSRKGQARPALKVAECRVQQSPAIKEI